MRVPEGLAATTLQSGLRGLQGRRLASEKKRECRMEIVLQRTRKCVALYSFSDQCPRHPSCTLRLSQQCTHTEAAASSATALARLSLRIVACGFDDFSASLAAHCRMWVWCLLCFFHAWTQLGPSLLTATIHLSLLLPHSKRAATIQGHWLAGLSRGATVCATLPLSMHLLVTDHSC